MHAEQFEQWRADFCHHFPSVAAWLNSLGTELKAKQLGFWAETLGDVPLDVACEVTGRLYRGDFVALGTYDSDRERTAAEIRQLAFSIIRERKHEEEPAFEPQIERPFANSAVSGISADFSRVVKLMESGVDREVAMRRVLGKRFAFTGDTRYRCTSCFDTGLAWVWSVRSMLAFKLGAFGKPGTLSTAVCPCECPKGETKITYSQPNKRPPRGSQWTSDEARYRPEKWCLCPWGDTGKQENQERFKLWAGEFFARLEIEKAKRLEKEAEAEALRQREF